MDAKGDRYTHMDAGRCDGYTNANAHPHRHPDTHANRHRHGYTYRHAHRDAYGDTWHTAGSTHRDTYPV